MKNEGEIIPPNSPPPEKLNPGQVYIVDCGNNPDPGSPGAKTSILCHHIVTYSIKGYTSLKNL